MFPTLGQWLHLERNGGLMKGTKKDSTFICSIFFFKQISARYGRMFLCYIKTEIVNKHPLLYYFQCI